MLISVRQFIKPDWRKLALFGVLLLIAVGGQIQTWMFSDDPSTKPLLYDLLRPLPLWFLWILTMIPLFLLVAPLREVTPEINPQIGRFFWIGLVSYYYLGACVIVFLGDCIKHKVNSSVRF